MAEISKPAVGWTQIYRSIFDQSLIGIVLCDLEGNLLECNPAFLSMIGYSSAEIAGKTVRDITHPDDWNAESGAMERIRSAPSRESHYSACKRYIHKDGRIIWANINATTIWGVQDQPRFGLAIVEDITERKQAEAGLRESEERYRSLFAEMTSGFALHDVILDNEGKPCNYRYLAINPAFEALTGLLHEKVVGRTVLEIIPNIEPEWISRFGNVAITGVPATFEDYVQALDKYFAVHAYCPRPGQFAVVFTDITERVRSQEKLEAEKERMSVVLRGISDAVIATDINGEIQLVNKLAGKWLALAQEDIAGKPIWTVLTLTKGTRKTPVAEEIEAAVRTKQRYAPETPLRLTDIDGSEHWLSVIGNPLFDRTSTPVGMVFVLHDVTERLRLDSERVKTEKLDSLSHMASGIAHDFNNLLTTSLGNVSLARSNAGTPAEVKHLLADAEAALQEARTLTRQLMTFAQGGSQMKTTVDPAHLIRDAVEFALRGSKSRLEFKLSAALWKIEADTSQIEQALRSLAINADEAMPGGGSIQIQAENVLLDSDDPVPLSPGRYVRCSITDSGVGIPERVLSKIFDPYFTTKQQGSGMGLATTLSIIRSHGGHISVDSRMGIGTTFDIYLPALEDTSAVPPPRREPPHTLGKIRVLVMDDEEAIRNLATRILSQKNCLVTTTSNGEEALAAYEAAQANGQPFDVVILDITIRGGMGGKDTIQRLREIDPSVKAIVSSGYSNDPVMSNYRRYGFRGIVPKPYQADDLIRAVSEIAQSRNGTPDNGRKPAA